MAMLVNYWQRRDSADRDAFARAAVNYCRAVRAHEGVRGSRYYWFHPDTVVQLTDGESLEVFDQPPTAEQAKALFALDDLARMIRTERWADARQGEETYRMAQSG